MMNEPKYLEMIRQGVVNINGDDFKIIRAYDGCSCCSKRKVTGCYFRQFENFSGCLNNVAQGICCSAGGHILRKIS